MKLLLINPPNRFWLYPPLGLGYIATAARNKGYDVEVLDMAADPVTLLQSKLYGVDVVGITCTSQTFQSALEVARKIKRFSPKITVVFGGPCPSAMPNKILSYKEVDIVVKGEGEQAILEVLKNSTKKGIIECDLLPIDAISTPARDLLPMEKYRSAKSIGSILTSRGCPFHCNFCCHSVSGFVWRGRKPENVVAEIEELSIRYKTRDIHVVDDNFSANINRAKEIMGLLINRKLGLNLWFYNGLRADRVDHELLMLMKLAGTKLISYGLESVDATVLRNICKKVSLNQVEEAVRLTHETGIKTRVSLMIGNVGDTFESVMRTVEWMRKNQFLDDAAFSLCAVYPGTSLYDWVEKHGRLLVEPENNPTYFMDRETTPSFDTLNFPAEMRLKALRIAQVAVQRKYTFRNKSIRNFKFKKVPLYVREVASILFNKPYKPKFRE